MSVGAKCRCAFWPLCLHFPPVSIGVVKGLLTKKGQKARMLLPRSLLSGGKPLRAGSRAWGGVLQAPRHGTGLLCSLGEDNTDEVRCEVRLSDGQCHGDGAEASV